MVIAVIVVAVWLFYKFTPLKYERFWTYLIAGLMIFVLFSFFTVVKKNQIDISDPGGFVKGAKFYAGWIFGLGKDAVKITGHAAKTDWTDASIKNITNSEDGGIKKKGW